MIDQLAFVITVGSLLTGIGVGAAAVVGRYRWGWSAPVLAVVALAVSVQVVLAVLGLLAGHRPASLGVHVAYLVVAVLAVPAVAVQVPRDDSRWAGLLVAVALVVLAVVMVRTQTTWRA